MSLPAPHAASDVRLSGRVIMVTGASGGLGKPLALACAARGATVVLHGRVVRKLEAIYDEIVAAGHPQPTILPLDLATAAADDFGHVASAIRAQLGRLDGLVHAAAFLGSLGPIEHQSFDAWQKVLRVNLAAAMALTRSMLPLLARRPTPASSSRSTRAARTRAPTGAPTRRPRRASRRWPRRWPTNGRTARAFGSMPSFPVRCARRCVRLTHPGEERSALPVPETLVPLYLHLLGAQAKPESGARIDAQAWLAHQPASMPLVAPAAAGRP